jgi:hypothetical protein
MNEYIIKLLVLTLVIFIINLPFGYLRGNVRKFSFKWFLYIHLPVPLIILLRIYSEVGFAFYTYPLFIGAFFMGQFVGRKYLSPLRVEKD